MSMMILGASGRLGRALWESRPQTLEVTALTHAELDVTDIRAVEAVIALARPDVVINAAAWTDVAGAQTNAAAARAVNAVAPGAMGRLFARTGVRIVHFSTDYVFSGEGSSPWNEASEAHPRQAGVYGVTKHAYFDGGARPMDLGRPARTDACRSTDDGPLRGGRRLDQQGRYGRSCTGGGRGPGHQAR